MVVRGYARLPGLWAGPAWGRVAAPAAMVGVGRAPEAVAHLAETDPAEIDPVVAGRAAGRVCAPVAAGTVVLAVVVPADLVVAGVPARVRPIQVHPAVGGPEAGRTVARVVVAPKVRRAAESSG